MICFNQFRASAGWITRPGLLALVMAVSCGSEEGMPALGGGSETSPSGGASAAGGEQSSGDGGGPASSGTSGGRASGGTTGAGGSRSTGGTRATGGSSNTGWLSGYTATMFGNVGSGDCAGVANFSDSTNISSANCTWMSGSLKVTIASYQSGVANNASYYAAPGDQSSIWSGPQCSCQSGQTEGTNGKCPSAPQCSNEQDCNQCFEVKCDPNGTARYSNGDTRNASTCNTSQSVVVVVIDACPHNHPTNTWWCQGERTNHIDISCSAMEAIASSPSVVGSYGWLNVQVRPVDCSVGLGVRPL